MAENVLRKARRLIRRRKFDRVIRILESQIFRFRNNAEFYTLLGSACLYSGDLGGAVSYYKRAAQISPKDPRPLLGLAAAELKRGDVEEAVKKWLEILELDEGNKTARRALNIVRKELSVEERIELDAKRIRDFFPPLPFDLTRLLPPLLVLLLVGLIFAGVFYLLPRLPSRDEVRPGIGEIRLSADHPPLVSNSGKYKIELTEEQIEESFKRIKSYLLDYRDNMARREINHILLSNASAYVKERARLLATFIVEPDFSSLKDNFTFQEVRENTAIYEACYVIWSGKAVNILIGEEAIEFDLLVGYQDERTLLGIVPVRLDFGFAFEPGDPVEVLGKIHLNGRRIELTGVSIHRLYGSGQTE